MHYKKCIKKKYIYIPSLKTAESKSREALKKCEPNFKTLESQYSKFTTSNITNANFGDRWWDGGTSIQYLNKQLTSEFELFFVHM